MAWGVGDHCGLNTAESHPYRPFPNQFPMQVTTLGQPVVWTKPFTTCKQEVEQESGAVQY